jgi:hypothetical protein
MGRGSLSPSTAALKVRYDGISPIAVDPRLRKWRSRKR